MPVYYLTCRRCPSCLRGEFNLCQNGLREWATPPQVAPHFRGGFATHYVVHPDQYFYRVPESLADSVVAGANCGLAQVIFALDRIGLRAGETLVVQGAGGLGLYACSVGRELGARVVVIEREPERLRLASRFGAHELVDMAELPTAETRTARVHKLTGGQGADVVLEVTGVAAAFPESIGLVRTGGRVVSMGNINVGAGHEVALRPRLLGELPDHLLIRRIHPAIIARTWRHARALPGCRAHSAGLIWDLVKCPLQGQLAGGGAR